MTPELEAILAARTRRLAKLPSQESTRAGETYMVAGVDETRYALLASAVVGVAVVRQLAKLPGVPSLSAGLIGFRGTPVVAFNATQVFAQSRQRLAERTLALVLGRHQPEAALLVDSVQAMLDIRTEQLLPAPAIALSEAHDLVVGVTDDGIIVLDIIRLFESKRMEARTYIRRQM